MRGKKVIQSNYYDEYMPEQTFGYLDIPKYLNLERERRHPNKRIPSGFVGSRGKRSLSDSSNNIPKTSDYNSQGNRCSVC